MRGDVPETILESYAATPDRLLGRILREIPSILIVVDAQHRITGFNRAAENLFGVDEAEVGGRLLECLPISWDTGLLLQRLEECLGSGQVCRVDNLGFTRLDGSSGLLGLTLTPVQEHGQGWVLLLGADVTDRKNLETQLAQAQKSESIGQLAAGIAHEINTPIQYVGDNLRFLMRTFDSLKPVLEQIPGAMSKQIVSGPHPVNVEFLMREIPNALAESMEGIRRVADIVRAMKEFSHPGTEHKELTDINHVISSTVTVARNEWKYVADLKLELDPELPKVPCLPGELNQVILNMVVNAAHAIEEVVRESNGRGKIQISTQRIGRWVEIIVSDTGCGITPQNRSRIFDPFFTTKEVGKGTGQGLALVHTSVVKRHQGSISVQSEPGSGSLFIIRLPMCAEEGREQAA